MEEIKKEEKKKNQKNKKPIDKTKIVTRIFAAVLMVLMVFSVFGTLLFYLIQG